MNHIPLSPSLQFSHSIIAMAPHNHKLYWNRTINSAAAKFSSTGLEDQYLETVQRLMESSPSGGSISIQDSEFVAS